MATGVGFMVATPIAFAVATAVNYWLSISLLFRHRARWSSSLESALFVLVVAVIGAFDLGVTRFFIGAGSSPWVAKSIAIALGLLLNFIGRRFIVFPEDPNPDWKPQVGAAQNAKQHAAPRS